MLKAISTAGSVLRAFESRAGAVCLFLLCGGPAGRRRGQTTVEYTLMLAVVVAVALMVGIAFHRRILGGFFTMIGMVLGGTSA